MIKMENFDFGKIENGIFSFAPKELEKDGVKILTNDSKIYKAAGWLKITHTPKPEKDGYYYTAKYTQKNGKIIEEWEEHEVPVPSGESGEISADALIKMIQEES